MTTTLSHKFSEQVTVMLADAYTHCTYDHCRMFLCLIMQGFPLSHWCSVCLVLGSWKLLVKTDLTKCLRNISLKL